MTPAGALHIGVPLTRTLCAKTPAGLTQIRSTKLPRVDPLSHTAPVPTPLVSVVRSLLRGEAVDWPAGIDEEQERVFVSAAMAHGIAPLLHLALSQTAAWDAAGPRPQDAGAPMWPAYVRAELRRHALTAAAAEVARQERLRAVLEALGGAGVDVLVLKGSALAYQLYPSPELRVRGDSDLLIRRADLDRVRAVMAALDAEELPGSGDELILRQAVFVTRSGTRELFDVHWSVTNAELFARGFTFDALRSRSVPIPALSPSARGLRRPDALLLAAIHRIAHHHGSDRLIWLYDLHLLHEAMEDDERRAFWTAAAEQEVVTVCIDSLQRAREWFGGSDADPAAFLPPERIARSEASASYLRAGRRRGHQEWSDVAALPGWPSRLRRLRQLALPPRDYMRRRYGSQPLALLYLYRGLVGIGRMFRRL
jgi:hypothetical protein